MLESLNILSTHTHSQSRSLVQARAMNNLKPFLFPRWYGGGGRRNDGERDEVGKRKLVYFCVFLRILFSRVLHSHYSFRMFSYRVPQLYFILAIQFMYKFARAALASNIIFDNRIFQWPF